MNHIGLNLLYMVPGETGGMEVAARKLIAGLTELAPADLRFTAFVNRETADEDLGIDKVVVPIEARSRVRLVQGEQLLLPRLATEAGCDLVHSLGTTSPARGGFRRLTTIHDLNYKRVPEAHFGIRAWGMKVLVPLSARSSHRILADSQSTKDDLVELLGVSPHKIEVVYLGCEQPTEHPTDAAELRGRLQLGNRSVLLSLSAKRPHKNLAGLLRALALIPVERRPLTVLSGYSTEYESELKQLAQALQIESDLRWVEWLSQADIEGLFALSNAFVFPSFYEGFGLPVLEAMVRGVPVACSDRASLPELAGDAALIFNPDSEVEIAQALERLLTGGAEIDKLRAAGRRQAEKFTWQRTVEQTVAIYRQTCDLGAGAGQKRNSRQLV